MAQAIGQAAIQQKYRVIYRETHVLLADAVVEGKRKQFMESVGLGAAAHQTAIHLRVEGEVEVVQRLVGYSRKSVRLLVFSSSSPDFPSSNPIRGAPYSFDFRALGGSGTYSRTLVSGSLPVGLSLDPASGIISGTPFENGSFSATYLITSDALQLLWNFGINVGSPTNPAISMPGWATPPDATVNTGYSLAIAGLRLRYLAPGAPPARHRSDNWAARNRSR